MIAWLFPGQGSQQVGMGRALRDADPSIRTWFDRADAALGFRLSQVMFEGPAETLTRTDHTQPAVFVTSLATLALTRRLAGDRLPAPSFVAGHSLGEYTALVAAGGLDYEAGLKLLRRRAELMQRAAETRPGSMAAVLALDVENVESACREATEATPDGVVAIANENADGQTVISGSVDAVAVAIERAKARGARRAMPLAVGGAFHSPLMTPAKAELAAAVRAAGIVDLTTPLIANVTGTAIRAASDVIDELSSQVDSRVRWSSGIETMIAAGVETFLEFGAGPITAWLKRRGGCQAIALDSPTAVEAYAASLS